MSSDASTMNKLLGSPQVRLWHTASTIKDCEDVKLPYPLKVWNYSACSHHETPDASCVWHLCGGDPFKHQNKTAAFSYKSRKSIVGNSTGTGKQQPISEPVLTPTGWRAIGDLKAGDFVMGANGKPTEVLQVHPQTERRTYKVTFNDGSWTLAGPEHLWFAGTKSGLSQGGRMKVVNTLKMLETIHRSWVIPQVEPIQYPQDGPLPCDPYLLGVCLGDGSVGKYGTITLSTDMEILDRLGISPTRDHKTSNFTKYAVVEKGLLNDSIRPQSRSWSKVIPERFMRATPEQRLDLLRGLMDTDGTPQHPGGTEYSTTSEVLAHQVQELAESLGGVARISGPRVTKYTHNGELREGRPSWRVNVKLPTGINPFYLTRKAEKYIMPTKYPARRIVKSIEQVEDQDSVCISVSAEDSLYVTRHHIVTHNTLSALLTLALAAHYGEPVRAIIVVPTISVKQWHAETSRWTPGFDTVSIPAKTPKRDRIQTYASRWNIIIMGYHAFTKDVKYLEKVGILQVISDDIDPALSVNNKTFQALESLCRKANLVVVQNATALQVNLLQLYASSRLIGGGDIWGSERNFQQMYVRKEKVTVMSKAGKKVTTTQAVGYRNLDHFKSKFSPMNIRITYDDITDDVQIPQLLTEQVYLEMSPRQRTRYTELQDAVRTVMNNKNLPASKKVVTALTAFTYGSQICSGTFCLKTVEGDHEPDAPDASPKLDWIIDKLNTDWVDEKVVVYAKFRGAISALQGRLQKNGIGFSTIWGVETDANIRQAEMERFWQDPDTRVMIISVSGERSLNLQNASILVMWDLQLNPARVAQIAGRVRRVGSQHKRVFVFELLHENTQEDRYMASLAARQTLFDYVYDIDNTDIDQDQLLISKLDPDQVLRLIRP